MTAIAARAACAALMLVCAALAPVPVEASPARAEALLRLAGLDLALQAMRDQFADAGAMAPDADPEGVRAAAEAFDPDALLAAIAAQLDATVSDDDLAAVERAAATPPMPRILAEERAAAAAGEAELLEGVRLAAKMADAAPDRLAQIETLLETTRVDDFTQAFARGALFAGILGMQIGAGLPVDEAEIAALADQIAESERESIATMTRASLVYAWRNLSGAELEVYQALSEQPYAQRYTDATLAAMGVTLLDAMTAYATAVGALTTMQEH